MPREKKRLDLLLADHYPNLTRAQLQSFIIQGKVQVQGKIMDKPGTIVPVDVELVLDAHEPKYVSRAGFKLEKALDYFNIDVKGLVVLDAGISTGGFTDCLLQRGAKRVYGVDVGHGQVHEKVRRDDRLHLLESTNLRHLDALPEKVDLMTLDLSFISILKVMPAVIKQLKPEGKIITLIKPQFEASREDIRRGGVVKDDSVYDKVFASIKSGMQEYGFKTDEIIESPIVGAKSGNKEFLALWTV